MIRTTTWYCYDEYVVYVNNMQLSLLFIQHQCFMYQLTAFGKASYKISVHF